MFNMLSIGKKALQANEKQLETTAHNISNVNTPGYSRQRVVQENSSPILNYFGNMGTGVDLVRVERMRDIGLDNEYRKLNNQLGYWDTTAKHLTDLEKNILETTEFGIGTMINNFFNSWELLSNNPFSTIHRMEVVEAAERMTESFRDLYRSIDDRVLDVKYSMQASADRINQIGEELASLISNITHHNADGRPINDLMDKFDLLIDELSYYGEVQVHHRENGTFSVYLGTDELARNDHYNKINLVEKSNMQTGEKEFFLSWNNSYMPIEGLKTGSLKALNDLKDSILPGYQQKLDDLAVQIAKAVNSIHTQGISDHIDNSGTYFFNPLVTGVMDFTLSKAVSTDPEYIVTSLTGATGDNQIALMITDLRQSKIFDGQTLTEAFADIVYGIGQDVKLSKISTDRSSMMVQQTDNFRESVKGVSINEETANLLKYQQAYQAAAKIISIADDMMKTIIGLAR